MPLAQFFQRERTYHENQTVESCREIRHSRIHESEHSFRGGGGNTSGTCTQQTSPEKGPSMTIRKLRKRRLIPSPKGVIRMGYDPSKWKAIGWDELVNLGGKTFTTIPSVFSREESFQIINDPKLWPLWPILHVRSMLHKRSYHPGFLIAHPDYLGLSPNSYVHVYHESFEFMQDKPLKLIIKAGSSTKARDITTLVNFDGYRVSTNPHGE